MKTHSYLFNIDNNPFTDLNNSLGVIYIVILWEQSGPSVIDNDIQSLPRTRGDTAPGIWNLFICSNICFYPRVHPKYQPLAVTKVSVGGWEAVKCPQSHTSDICKHHKTPGHWHHHPVRSHRAETMTTWQTKGKKFCLKLTGSLKSNEEVELKRARAIRTYRHVHIYSFSYMFTYVRSGSWDMFNLIIVPKLAGMRILQNITKIKLMSMQAILSRPIDHIYVEMLRA